MSSAGEKRTSLQPSTFTLVSELRRITVWTNSGVLDIALWVSLHQLRKAELPSAERTCQSSAAAGSDLSLIKLEV